MHWSKIGSDVEGVTESLNSDRVAPKLRVVRVVLGRDLVAARGSRLAGQVCCQNKVHKLNSPSGPRGRPSSTKALPTVGSGRKQELVLL